MKKMTCTVLIIMNLVLAYGTALAASNKCRIVEVEEQKLILECERDTSGFKAGDRVKIKSDRRGAAVEGC